MKLNAKFSGKESGPNGIFSTLAYGSVGTPTEAYVSVGGTRACPDGEFCRAMNIGDPDGI